jgi:hypothetical protein
MKPTLSAIPRWEEFGSPVTVTKNGVHAVGLTYS